MRGVFLLILIALSLFTTTTIGQIQNSLFKNFSVTNGLTDERIHCVFQDSKGWIWVGTDYGMARFDGYEFIPFRMNGELGKALETMLIRTIVEDSHGNIWIGTDINGALKYNPEKNELTQYLKPESVWAIQEDKQGDFWIGTESGLIFFNTKNEQAELKLTAEHKHIAGNFVRKIFIDAANRIWVGTNNGITVLNPDNTIYKSYLTGGEYAALENEIWEIFKDDENQLWVGTYLGGLKKFNSIKNKFENFDLDPGNERSLTVRSIVQDKNGDLWFGTRGGLYSFDYATQQITMYENSVKNDYSLIHNSVLDLLIDAKGDLWAGTRNGLSFLNFGKKAFGYISADNNGGSQLNNSEVYKLWEDPDQKLWIGTESGGVNIFDQQKGTLTYLTTKQGLSNNCIKAISPDNSGNVLIGTYLGGLNQYNPKTGRNRVFKNNPNDTTSISDDAVWDIFIDSKGKIWIATSNGVDIFNPDKGTFTHRGQKLNLGWVVLIHEDNAGNLWFCSTDKKTITKVTQNGKTNEYAIEARSICNDNLGNVWFGTLGGGLIKHNLLLNTFESYTVDSGLCSNVVLGLLNINDEFLWLSTNSGISRFNLKTKKFKNFFSTDGLLNTKFNYGAYMLTSDNVLVFGGKKGVDFIFLDQLRDNEFIPPVVVTGFKLFNKTVEPSFNGYLKTQIYETHHITLPYNQNMLSFTFAALNYANIDKNQYWYKLEGLDKEWNDIGTQRSAYYTNLDFGDYVFKVCGSNSDGLFNPEGTSIAITILPPFWKTWWFRLVILVTILLLFYIIYLLIINREKLKHQLTFERKSARKLQEVDRLKHQFFMNISHEIKTPLSLITGPLNKLLTNENLDEGSKSLLAIIRRNTQTLEKLVSQLLDYRKLETGNLQLDLKDGNILIFVEELVNSFVGIAEERGITLNLQVFHKSLFLSFDEDKVEKILNNLISNAIKYTPDGGNVTVSITIQLASEIDENNTYIPTFDPEKAESKSYIKITVSDTGIGIPDSQIGRIFDRFRRVENDELTGTSGVGIGLALTKELVKLHHGYIKVSSKEKKGSKFTVILPYNELLDKAKKENKLLTMSHVDNYENDEQSRTRKNVPLLLIIDDNPDIREFIKHQFEPEYEVLQAKNGKEGWETALDQIPDIVVSDIMMPVMNGNEFCKKLKSDERTSHIPIIMLTALTSTDQQIAGIDAGADDYLTKPFDVALLKAKTDNILAIRKALREKYSKEMLLKPTDVILTSPDEKFLKKLIQCIEKNISKSELDVDHISKQVGVSRTQLYRKLSALTNMTPKEFVRDIRLKRAAQLLTQQKLNISEIADETGFSDISYFRKVFKEKFGMSASQYQRSNG